MSELVVHLTDQNFTEQVKASTVPILVDFWAAWCQPCKMIAPILDEIAEQYQGRLKIAKVNVDESQEIPSQYGIRGIPTLILFKGGEAEAQKVGALNKAQLVAFIDSHL
ncbi:MAG: thioredoxin TrxA [Pseudomonadota bacterium]